MFEAIFERKTEVATIIDACFGSVMVLLWPDGALRKELVRSINESNQKGQVIKEVIQKLKKHLTNSDHRKQLLSLRLLHHCWDECGSTFPHHLAPSGVLPILVKLINKTKTNQEVRVVCLYLVQHWAAQIAVTSSPQDHPLPQFDGVYSELVSKGIQFPAGCPLSLMEDTQGSSFRPSPIAVADADGTVDPLVVEQLILAQADTMRAGQYAVDYETQGIPAEIVTGLLVEGTPSEPILGVGVPVMPQLQQMILHEGQVANDGHQLDIHTCRESCQSAMTELENHLGLIGVGGFRMDEEMMSEALSTYGILLRCISLPISSDIPMDAQVSNLMNSSPPTQPFAELVPSDSSPNQSSEGIPSRPSTGLPWPQGLFLQANLQSQSSRCEQVPVSTPTEMPSTLEIEDAPIFDPTALDTSSPSKMNPSPLGSPVAPPLVQNYTGSALQINATGHTEDQDASLPDSIDLLPNANTSTPLLTFTSSAPIPSSSSSSYTPLFDRTYSLTPTPSSINTPSSSKRKKWKFLPSRLSRSTAPWHSTVSLSAQRVVPASNPLHDRMCRTFSNPLHEGCSSSSLLEMRATGSDSAASCVRKEDLSVQGDGKSDPEGMHCCEEKTCAKEPAVDLCQDQENEEDQHMEEVCDSVAEKGTATIQKPCPPPLISVDSEDLFSPASSSPFTPFSPVTSPHNAMTSPSGPSLRVRYGEMSGGSSSSSMMLASRGSASRLQSLLGAQHPQCKHRRSRSKGHQRSNSSKCSGELSAMANLLLQEMGQPIS